METKKKSSAGFVAFLALAAITVGLFLVYGNGNSEEKNKVLNNTTGTGGNENDYVSIPISEITKQTKKYTYDVGGNTIRYLAVLGSDGNPRVAIDGCTVCRAAKGFSQSGTDLVCNTCGKHFKIDDIGSGNQGPGCWPIRLAFSTGEGRILIKKADLEADKIYF